METPQQKILIIEDDFFVRDLYNRELTREGFAVSSAEDGPTGLLKVVEEKPDLVLLDIMLPKMSGLDVLKTLKEKEETKNIPVVLLTNLGQDSVIREGFTLGAVGYLIKAAYTPTQIVEEVKKFLRESSKTE
jgi:DNA-binding response OmpR family regulator